MRVQPVSTALGLVVTMTTAHAYAGQRGKPIIPPTPHTQTIAHQPTGSSGAKAAAAHPLTTTVASPPIAQKIASHPQLASKVQALLPSGTTLNTAATGFKNQGQFIAALHVSQNLGLRFADLKAQMVGKHRSLGQSIQTLKPASGPAAIKAAARGEREADDDIKGATTTAKKLPRGRHDSRPVAPTITTPPQLAARLQPLLPPGTTLAQAAQGFRNQGQFIAALHVSKNLGIPFAQLKAEMTGTDHDSLGRAIQELRPTADAQAAARQAENEAHADLKTIAAS